MSFLQPSADKEASEGNGSIRCATLTAPLLVESTETVTNPAASGGGQHERRKCHARCRCLFAVSVFIITHEKHRFRPQLQSLASDESAASEESELLGLKAGSEAQPEAQPEAQIEALPEAQPEALPESQPQHHHVIHMPLEEPFLSEVERIVREKDYNSLQELGGVDAVLGRLRPHLEEAAAHVDGSQDLQAWNTSNLVHGKGFPHFLVKACNKYAIFILLELAILSFSVESLKQGVKYGWHDSVAIVLAVLALVAFPSVGNYLHERKLERKQLEDRRKLEVNVERYGSEAPYTELVAISNVVVGNIVRLKKGDRVPADGLFIDGEDLVLDEALNPKIDREQNPFVLSGSKVIEGHGRIVVISVGANTALAQLMNLVTQNPNDENTPVQILMDKQYVFMDYITLGGAILIVLVVLIRALCFGIQDNYNDRPELKGEVSMLMKMFEFVLKPQGRIPTLASALATAVIGIQHGMPFAITMALGKWNEKMVRNQAADPQNLSACITLGLVTALCIETTAQLLRDQMELVKEFWMGGKDLISHIDGASEAETNQNVLEALQRGISAATPASDLLISWVKAKWGTDMELWHQKFDKLEQRNLSCDEKCSGFLIRRMENDELEWHCNGAASTILDMCSHYYNTRGEIHIIEDQKRKFEQMIEKMKENGLRPIAYAYKKAEAEAPQELTEDGLFLLALVGLRTPYQEELKSVVETFRNAGKIIKLVSEDDLITVRDKASELGIPNDRKIEGEVFRRLNTIQRRDKVDLISVMGNSLPIDKFLMVDGLKKNGHIVAFYGGLTVCDTPTLKEADVGIAEDVWSTEMAGANADLIIRNGCFLTQNLKSGACAYHNIQQFSQLQLTFCISGLLITLVATVHSGESPLTAIHLIWVNLIMCLLGYLMMVMELKGQELLITQTPANRTQLLVTKEIWGNIAIQVSYQASVLLILHFMGHLVPSLDGGVRNTMIFNTFTVCQVVNLFNAMDLVNKEVLKVVLGSYWFLMALGAVLAMQVVIVEFGQGLSSGVKLNALQWAICCLLAGLSWGFGWAIKLLSAGLTSCSTALTSVMNSLAGFLNSQNGDRVYMHISFFPI